MMRTSSKTFGRLVRGAVFLGIGMSVAAPSRAADFFPGKVIEVVDGDTIRVAHQGKQVTVRLQGVDAPELKQPYGARAKQFTEELTSGQTVLVAVISSHRGETIAEVIFKDGRSLSREIIRAGLGWWDRRHVDDPALAVLMVEARRAHRGLWSDPNPIAPCVFRLMH